MKEVRELLRQHHRERDGSHWHLTRDMTVFAALEKLAAYHVGALMVLDGERLVGVFSERDYTRKIALEGRNSRDTTVGEIMTSNVITVHASARTYECMVLMSEKRIRHLPVVDGHTVLGMISIRDVMNDVIAEHEGTIEELQRYINT
jgi:CBS domain-containing protein